MSEEPPSDAGERGERDDGDDRFKPSRIYSVLVGLAFVAIVIVALVNTIGTGDSGVKGPGGGKEGTPLAQFAVPDARSSLEGDANIAQDDCESSRRPCPDDERRTPACKVSESGAIRVCDLFGRPLVLSFWFTRWSECTSEQDAFEAAYRRFRDRVNFLAVNIRDERDKVRELIDEHGWTHPIGLDSDGALSNVYRIGVCPTLLFAFPGGILQRNNIGELDEAELDADIEELIAASRRRAEIER